LKINSQTTSDDHQLLLTVEIEAETMETARQKAARKIAQRVKIPGFRPGKAPFNVIEKQVGADAIRDEALDIVLDDVYPKLIEETGVKPYGPGTLEKVHEDKTPPVFEFRVPLSPEVKLGEYDKIRLPYEDKKPEEKDIEKVLNDLREQSAMLSPVERAAQEGDIAYILMSANRQDGGAELLPERRYPVVVEKADVDTKTEWPFPGFSRTLIAMKAGEEKSFPHTFGKDSEFEDLRGQTADFKIKMEEIKARELPVLDDAFAQTLGEYKTVADLRTEIEGQLTENFKRQVREEYEDLIVTKMIADSEIKFPPQMLHHEVHHYIEDMVPDLNARGLDLDTYLKSRQLTLEQFEEEVEPRVEERLKKSLVIMEASRKENIEVPESEVQTLVEQKLGQLQQALSEQELRRLLNKDNIQGLVSRTLTEEVIRRTLARLGAIAQGKGEEHRKETAAASVSKEAESAEPEKEMENEKP
jgi:trigger factor